MAFLGGQLDVLCLSCLYGLAKDSHLVCEGGWRAQKGDLWPFWVCFALLLDLGLNHAAMPIESCAMSTAPGESQARILRMKISWSAAIDRRCQPFYMITK